MSELENRIRRGDHVLVAIMLIYLPRLAAHRKLSLFLGTLAGAVASAMLLRGMHPILAALAAN